MAWHLKLEIGNTQVVLKLEFTFFTNQFFHILRAVIYKKSPAALTKNYSCNCELLKVQHQEKKGQLRESLRGGCYVKT